MKIQIDHERAWDWLRNELGNLAEQSVQQVPPLVILAHMDFIEDILQWESKEEK